MIQNSLPSNLDNPAVYLVDPFGAVVGFDSFYPPAAPAINQAPPNNPPPAMAAIGPPNPPPATAATCTGPSQCPDEQVCQVSANRLGSTQGCVAAVDALIGIAYDMLGVGCATGGPGRCLLSTPPPPQARPVTFYCACNCTYTSAGCCGAKDGIVNEEYTANQQGQLTAPSGQCCNSTTGTWSTTAKGTTNVGNKCPVAASSSSSGINVGGGTINSRRIRGLSRNLWEVAE